MKSNRREFIVASSLAVVGSAIRQVRVHAQQPPGPIVPQFATLRRNVGTFTGRGGTIGWLIAPDALAVVDSQFADAAEVFLKDLAPRTGRKIDLLVNSHHHPDHTLGNKVLRPKAARIVAHENSAIWQRKRAAAQNAEDAQAYPDETFKDAWKVDLGSESISAKYYGAGHTGGDVAVFFERADVVHLGDLMSHYRHPRVDLESGASVRHWIVALEQIVKDHGTDTLYIYGHSKPGAPVSGRRADLVVMRDYFTAVLDFVQKAVKAGRSQEEVVKTPTIPGFPQHEGELNYVLQAAYAELSGKSPNPPGRAILEPWA